MRCPNCNKFVSIEMADPGIDDIDIDDSGYISASIRIVKTCADCGEELEEAVLGYEADEPIDHTHNKNKPQDFSIEDNGADAIDRREGKGRYAKTFYGASVGYIVRCNQCDYKEEGSFEIETQASSFDSLV